MADPRATHDLHFRRLERMYASAAINRLFPSTIVVSEARAVLTAQVLPEHSHAAGAAHGSLYFKLLDDAAFYAVNSLVHDVFCLTTAFNLFLTRPITAGPLVAEGRWVSGRRRVFIAEATLRDPDGEEVGRGTGTFMRSRIPLNDLAGYADGPA
jgi:uncharacterized protein (TIGR00369 family)